jgi:hypothetical protein
MYKQVIHIIKRFHNSNQKYHIQYNYDSKEIKSS